MTPSEKDDIKKMFERLLEPIHHKIRALEGVDVSVVDRLRTHSGTHKDLVADIRSSAHDIKATTNADLLAATSHLAGVIEDDRSQRKSFEADMLAKADFLYAEVTKLKAVPAQAAASTSAALDTKLAVKDGQTSSRNRTIATILAMTFLAILQHFAKG